MLTKPHARFRYLVVPVATGKWGLADRKLARAILSLYPTRKAARDAAKAANHKVREQPESHNEPRAV